MTARRRNGDAMRRGHTVVELMVVLTLIGILASLALPSFSALIRKQQITSTANELLAAITLTRAEAIRRNRRVDLVPADGVEWATGWIVQMPGESGRGSSGGATIIQVHGPVPTGIAIKSVMTDSAQPYIAFIGSGRTRTHASGLAPQAGHFGLTLGALERRIILNFLGRPRLCNPVADRACG